MTSTEVAIVMPAMIIVILFVFQIALFWHAKQAADVAAEEAVDAAQVAAATAADGYAGADTILGQAGNLRNASVTASYPGMSAERVEDLITEPLEAAMREIAEIDEIKSTSKTGSVKIELIIHDSVTDLDAVFQDIRNKADDVKTDLPAGTQGPYVDDEVVRRQLAKIEQLDPMAHPMWGIPPTRCTSPHSHRLVRQAWSPA